MAYSLEKHKDMVSEVGKSTRQVRPLLLIVKDDLRDMSIVGMPVNFMMTKLKEIGVSCRPETLRRFLSDEFPEAYEQFYQRKPRHERGSSYEFESKVAQSSSVGSTAASTSNKPSDDKSVPAKRKAQKLDIRSLSNDVSGYREGKHLDNDPKGD